MRARGGFPFAPVLLAATVLTAYGGVYDAPFIFDDFKTVLREPGADLAQAFRAHPTRIVPELSFALNRALGGSLAGFHALNVLIHLLNAFLVLGLLRAMKRLRPSGIPPWAPVSGALIWALHPLQTSAVTYLSQRVASLSALCYLCAALCYLRARERQIGGARFGAGAHLGWYLCALLAALLAAGAKENAATLPAAILLLELVIVGRREGERIWARLAGLLPFAVTPGLQIGHLLWIKFQLGAALTQATPLPGAVAGAAGAGAAGAGAARGLQSPIYGYLGVYQGWNFPMPREYLLTEAGVLVRYLKLWLLPINQVFDAYVVPVTRAADPRFLFPAALLLAIGGAALSQARRRPWVTFGVLWFYVTMAVESSFIAIADFMFEHRMLLPSFGLMVASLGLVGPWLSRRRRTGTVLIILITLLLGAATVDRNRVWESPLALWLDNVAKAPLKVRGWVNLAHVYEMNKQFDLAEAAFIRANKVFDRTREIHFGLGVVQMQKGDSAAAEKSFRRAIEIDPFYPEAHYNLAALLAMAEREKEAERLLRWVLFLKSEYGPEAHYNLGVIYLKQGKSQAALGELEAALPSLGNTPQLHETLAMANRRLGRQKEARRHADLAVRLRREAAGRSE